MASLYVNRERAFALARNFCRFAIVMALGAGAALSQEFPRKPIRMLIGFPAGGPIDVVARIMARLLKRLHGEIVRVVTLPEIREKLVAQGMEPVGSTPDDFARFMRSEVEKWARVIKSANIRPEQ